MNNAFFLVDLPGYGYARVPVALRDAWSGLIEWYLSEKPVKGVVHLVDARHAPTEHDLHMVEYLAEIGLPALIVLTKMDKLKKSEQARSIQRAVEDSKTAARTRNKPVPFSSKTGEGRETSFFSQALDALLESAAKRRSLSRALRVLVAAVFVSEARAPPPPPPRGR